MVAEQSIAEQYIEDVLAGVVVTSKLVRMQIERHARDLREADERGLFFDRQAAEDVTEFFPLFLSHYEGEWAGKPFELRPDQQAMLWILYGWKWKETKYRRFKYAYIEQARGTGKSPLAAGLCIYELYAFGEAGAQIYTAATDKDTARVVFNTAKRMVEESDYLRGRIQCGVNSMYVPATASFCQPVSSEDKNLLGKRPSFTVLDELHVHSSDGIWTVFDSASGKRPNSLMFAITNSGYDRNSVCWKKREYVVKILQKVIPDDAWFGWICGLDEEDLKDTNGWKNEANWIKPAPSLGITIRIEEMRRQARQAENDPSALSAFLRYQLCVWTSGQNNWMPMEKWEQCGAWPVEREQLRGRICFGGLDLSTTTDVSAFVLLFPPVAKDTHWYVLPWFFLPKDNIERRVRKDRVPYDVWERQGHFLLTEGNVIDYDYIRTAINAAGEEFEIKEIAFDPFNAQQLVTQLTGDGFQMVTLRQGFLSLNAPTKRLMELVLTGALAHGNHPVMNWMASNVIAAQDAAGNIKPDKGASREKIDGIAALVNALARAIVMPERKSGSPFGMMFL